MTLVQVDIWMQVTDRAFVYLGPGKLILFLVTGELGDHCPMFMLKDIFDMTL